MAEQEPATPDDPGLGWRVFEDARLLWVRVSRPINFEDPGSSASSMIAEALETFDYSGSGLCFDLRHATVTGRESVFSARASATTLAGFDLAGMKVALVGDPQTIRDARIRSIVIEAWLGVEMTPFLNIGAALDWLGVSDKVSPADLVVPAH